MPDQKNLKLHQKNLKKLQRATELADARQFAEAVSVLTEIISADPKNARAFNARAWAHMELEKDRLALEDFQATLRIDRNFPGARDWLARLQEKMGNHQAAAQSRQEDLKANRGAPHAGMGVNPQAFADNASSFIKSGEPEKARALLEKYFAGPVNGVTGYVNFATAPMRIYAKLLLGAGEKEGALEYSSKAVAHAHANFADQATHAQILLAFGRVEEAKEIHAELFKTFGPGKDFVDGLGDAIAKTVPR